jgi:hypothetical protein
MLFEKLAPKRVTIAASEDEVVEAVSGIAPLGSFETTVFFANPPPQRFPQALPE